MALKIYLAGPDVFLANAGEVGRRKQELCRQFGFEGLFPLDQDEAVAAGDAMEIFRVNCSLMRQADIGMLNLTPFRGPSADAGTVFELGFLFAQGKRIYGYAGMSPIYADRVEVHYGRLVERDGRRWDRDGYAVEDFSLSDNLMIVCSIWEAGGSISVVEEKADHVVVAGREKADKDLILAAFKAFEACLKVVANDVRSGRLKLGL
jgi:nucleoside 2-deoxyribosyltransferase